MPKQGPVATGLLQELAKSEQALRTAERKLEQVKAEFDVEARKYAAIRDATAALLGVSPYDSSVAWPHPLNTTMAGRQQAQRLRGKYRFIYVPVADAILQVLSESAEPLSLEEMQRRMVAGGASVDSLRVVNAAIMGLVRNGRVIRHKDGRYEYVKRAEAVDPDDLPFE
jgi:hypothetical protein